MYTQVNKTDFHNAFKAWNRSEQFSYEALNLIFDFLEEVGNAIGEEPELDVIAICCEFTEENWAAIAHDYSIDLPSNEDDAINKQAVIEHLQVHTRYVGETGDKLVFVAY